MLASTGYCYNNNFSYTNTMLLALEMLALERNQETVEKYQY